MRNTRNDGLSQNVVHDIINPVGEIKPDLMAATTENGEFDKYVSDGFGLHPCIYMMCQGYR